MVRFRVEVSAGELVDRITILELKSERIEKPGARTRARAALDRLRDDLADLAERPGLEPLRQALADTNAALWDIEEELRELERRGDFGARFIEAARSVYHRNDERARLKREIDQLLGSDLVEDKSYI